MANPKFDLGQIVATPDALAMLEQYNVTPAFFLDRHVSGDWGTVDAHDKAANDRAVTNNERVVSCYAVADEKLWVITEWDRSVTTLLLPSEY